MASEFNQEQRARRLREVMRAKEEELARRRGAQAAVASAHHLQSVAAVALMAATAAWLAGFSPEWRAALGLIGEALLMLSGLQPLLLGIAVGCLFAGFNQLRARQGEADSAPSPQPATLMLWLSLLFLVLSLPPIFA